jgi:hypothetical protein
VVAKVLYRKKMKEENDLKILAEKIKTLPRWKRWNNYKDVYDTSRITKTFLNSILLPEKNESILDFGSGFALNEYYAKKMGIKIDSLDIDTQEVRDTFKKVHEILELETYLYDGKNIPFSDDKYDKIIFKASITKFVNSNPIDIFSELLRISKKNSTWYISPTYMYPRFIEKITEIFASKVFSGQGFAGEISNLYSQVIDKNITIVIWDWTKRSTFAISSQKDSQSKIGWIPAESFEKTSMMTLFKYATPQATAFVSSKGVKSFTVDMLIAFSRAPGAIDHSKINEDFLNQISRDWMHIIEKSRQFSTQIKEVENLKKINVYANWNNGKKVKKTFIVARGKSSSLIQKNDIKATEQERVIFVNDWKESLTEYAFSNFSSESLNIHFLNRDVNLNKLEDRQYFDKKFSMIQLNCEDTQQDTGLIERVKMSSSGEIYGVSFMPKGMITTPVKTAGLHAVFYAVKILNEKNIEIFGLDFFEANYMTRHVVTGKPEPREYQPEKGAIAKKQFLELVKNNQDVSFTINTCAKFSKEDENLKNLTVNYLNN